MPIRAMWLTCMNSLLTITDSLDLVSEESAELMGKVVTGLVQSEGRALVLVKKFVS